MFLQGCLQSNYTLSGFTKIEHNAVFCTGNIVAAPSNLESFK